MSARTNELDHDSFRCTRCSEPDREPLGSRPFPDELGDRIVDGICSVCWEEWKRRQMLLINHYGLSLRDQRAREFLLANLRSFLFAEGGPGADIDTSQEGKVDW